MENKLEPELKKQILESKFFGFYVDENGKVWDDDIEITGADTLEQCLQFVADKYTRIGKSTMQREIRSALGI